MKLIRWTIIVEMYSLFYYFDLIKKRTFVRDISIYN